MRPECETCRFSKIEPLLCGGQKLDWALREFLKTLPHVGQYVQPLGRCHLYEPMPCQEGESTEEHKGDEHEQVFD